jgi:chromosome segregation ATPase
MMAITKALEYAKEVVKEYERYEETEIDYYDDNAEAFRALLEYIDMCHATDRKRNEKVKSLIAEVERLNAKIDYLRSEETYWKQDADRMRNHNLRLYHENRKYESALREIDTHIRSTPEPVPYIIETLKRTLPEYGGDNE